MTKERPPVSFELGLTRVAGLIGWDRTATILCMSERTARDRSDPDTQPCVGDSVNLDEAVALDAAYRAAGGDGAPMLQCFALKVETALAGATADAAALARRAAQVAEETGQAVKAIVLASVPGASPVQRQIAAREAEEAISALTATLSDLRGPEVPPPVTDTS